MRGWAETVLQGFGELLLVEIDDDLTIDIEGGGDALAARPGFHLRGSLGFGVDIDLDEIQVAGVEPDARPAAIGAPLGAIHDDAAMRQAGLRRRLAGEAAEGGCGFKRCSSWRKTSLLGWLSISWTSM